ncbi:acetyl-CoA/propionyl-CoA carboxylase biotin carboxyl carrier protein [Microbacterium esteraromaticum]|uniref:acetyl/propionyl/methylcrotonyl-CoA carboxylase subunit alpha n=3 Tax=Microbacterium esteraromaticum TaxID=57043 RepID=UPI00195F0BD3|nr:biotin carboxylase N-terminal domain-containing protein [Microbacterium esteraromaticum]MBM7464464.1 acetyl-CoA/propionyl-CoA carboxylase biotin carboxyl carrier protein [Microbacterium esteraromaticum]
MTTGSMTTGTTTIDTVLVANRGEIARRIIRTLRELGVRSVAVYSDADARAPHVREADQAMHIGGSAAADSYLNVDAIMAAARASGAQAIHPGYGFLSESVQLARACAAADMIFIGPDERALDIMGDKATARDHVARHGVPVVPGFNAAGLDDAQIRTRADEIGYPLLVKPSAGGGGKGMEIVRSGDQLAGALATARRVATAAFGDDSMVLERLVQRPRHIEVQVFGDAHGTVIALGERECTLQRRHQKVIEEAPAAALPDAVRRRLLDAAVAAARSVDYVGAGTVEFLVEADAVEDIFFIEMNTRLQVEHPVTEEVTGLDLVALQLHIAAGGAIDPAPAVRGHAVEARVYAESPERGFLPSTGRVLLFDPPRDVRVDAAIETGSEISGHYDPMIAKVIAYGAERTTALRRLDAALARTVVLGVETNIAFLRALIRDERVMSGDLDTGLIETMLPFPAGAPTPSMLAAAAHALEAQRPVGAGDIWHQLPGWRLGGTAQVDRPVFLTDDDEVIQAPAAYVHGIPTATDAGGAVWTFAEGATARLRPLSRRSRMQRRLAEREQASGPREPEGRAPMPGSIVAVHVAEGDLVRAGDPIVSIEAMKMEHPVLAPHDGTVHLLVALGDQVRRDQPVVRVSEEETA